MIYALFSLMIGREITMCKQVIEKLFLLPRVTQSKTKTKTSEMEEEEQKGINERLRSHGFIAEPVRLRGDLVYSSSLGHGDLRGERNSLSVAFCR